MTAGEFPGDYKTPAIDNTGDDYPEYLDDRKRGGKCRDCGQELGAGVICPSCGADNSSTPPFERTVDSSGAKID